jgi:Tfp pilus assembly protein FimT
MRSLGANAGHRRDRASGFSLLEMMIVVAISIVITVISVVSLVPVLNAQHVTNAYNTTLSAMRLARDNAVSQQTSYSVAFSNSVSPNTITIAPTLVLGFTGQQTTVKYTLPTDVTFQTNAGITSTAAPDSGAGANFGTGANAIDFGYTGTTNVGGAAVYTVYFCPDGSAQVSSTCAGVNNWDEGVVYLARAGDVLSARAVTLWGGTGRIHGWRLYPKSGGGYQWLRQ